MWWIVTGIAVVAAVTVLIAGYLGVVTGAVVVDLGVGRRTRQLGPQIYEIAAPRELVFDIIAAPYLQRQPRAVAEKVKILERAADMVMAAHRTPVHGKRVVATTVETVRFERPGRVAFRLVRGPVPHVMEEFVLSEASGGTRLEYHGELGTDFWALGSLWGLLVARAWERAVNHRLESVKAEAERRNARSR